MNIQLILACVCVLLFYCLSFYIAVAFSLSLFNTLFNSHSFFIRYNLQFKRKHMCSNVDPLQTIYLVYFNTNCSILCFRIHRNFHSTAFVVVLSEFCNVSWNDAQNSILSVSIVIILWYANYIPVHFSHLFVLCILPFSLFIYSSPFKSEDWYIFFFDFWEFAIIEETTNGQNFHDFLSWYTNL